MPRPLSFLTLLWLLTDAQSVALCPSQAERWDIWQCTWSVENLPPKLNPFDVDMLIDLYSPTSRKNMTVRGFYDGDGLFTARFMPPIVDVWSWRTRCDTVSSLDDHIGKITVAVPQAARNHGPVHTAKGHGNTKFAYADGTAWHSVGTTVYGLAGSSWGSAPANTSATLDTLRGRGSVFNKVVRCLRPLTLGRVFSDNVLRRDLVENDGIPQF
eukprot:COSAG02_NODE_147_length_33939_cov_6.689539_21_plen_213_part_00